MRVCYIYILYKIFVLSQTDRTRVILIEKWKTKQLCLNVSNQILISENGFDRTC